MKSPSGSAYSGPIFGSRSEQELQCKLDLPRGVGRLRDDPRGGVIIIPRKSHGVRRRKICAIQQVEGLHPKLQPVLLTEGEVLEQGRVKIREPRPNERTARHVSEGPCKRQQETVGIEVASRSAEAVGP